MLENLFKKKDIATILREANENNGGLKRNLSVFNLVALGIGAIVGTGIFVITGQAAASYAGPALTISFLISALGCIMAGLCYAEFSAMIPVAGSVYSYCYVTIGEFLAWFIGWTLILEYLFACSSVAVGWSGYVVSLMEGWNIHLPQQIAQAPFDHIGNQWVWTGSLINFPAVFIIVLVSSFLIGGIKQSAFINNMLLLTPFVPVPVIELVLSKGYLSWSKQEGETIQTFFRKK
jgi:Amino acid transporters